MKNLGSPIVTFEEFNATRPAGRIVVTGGGFDPIHPGHISSLQASAEFGDVVVAVVNGDAFLRAKKGQVLPGPGNTLADRLGHTRR